MNSRYLGALLLSPLLIFLFLGGIYLKSLVLVLSLFGMYEFYKVVKEKNIHAFSIISYSMCIAYYLTLSNEINYAFIFLLIVIATVAMLCIPVIYTKYNFLDVASTLLGFIYVSIPFSFIVMVNEKAHGNYFVWLIFISSWLCDTAAYYTGRAFGKHKLCPEVSPKKTVEGSIGGLIGSAIGCAILGFFINNYAGYTPIYHYVIIGVFCGIMGQFGDLVASSIKRFVGVKDYSNLIPGHGGILDRFDSILFASVVVYYYITFIMGM